MPIYEIEITATRMVCVEAEDELRAIALAMDNAGLGWDNPLADVETEFDPTDRADRQYIADYKRQGEFYSEDT